MEDSIKEWVEISEYDLETAMAMLETGKYIYVAFMAQQALEKILKALYVKNRNELPPRTHNLLYLLEIQEIKMNDNDLSLLSQLNQFYLESRYPGERIQLAKEMNKNKAQEILSETKRILLRNRKNSDEQRFEYYILIS